MAARHISAEAARRLAMRAHGLARPRPTGRVDRRHVRRAVDDLGLIQLDSVNVIDRTQHLVLFSRLGPHRRELFREAVDAGELVEGWVHEASVIPAERHHLFHWRRAATAAPDTMHSYWSRWVSEHGELIDNVRTQVARRGPLTVSDLSQPRQQRGPWWGWDDAKLALEWLFRIGEVGATRGPNFERRYDLMDRVLPTHAPTTATDRAEAHRSLVLLATQHLGIGTDADIADYYRLKLTEVRPHIADLTRTGELEPWTVDGWDRPGYVIGGTTPARGTSISALVSPFDPVVWFRPRAERMYDFHYRIEIYTPAAKRKYGYYVLPFIHRNRPRARVDLKHDRQSSTLLCKAAWGEATDDDPSDTAAALRVELGELARHLGASQVEVYDRGDLSGELRSIGDTKWQP
jgi:uncharacterized protein